MPSHSEARLVIVCGLPGSGKSTLASRLAHQLRAIRFCADEWMETLAVDLYDGGMRARIEELQWRVAKGLLAQDLVVIIEWGTWARAERDRLRAEARSLGAAVELHYLEAPAEVLYARLTARGKETPPIPRETVERWMDQIERPTTDEYALYDPPLASYP